MMKHCFSALAAFCAAALAVPSLHAQATATATGRSLSAGVSYQTVNPDYGPSRSSGVGIFVNYDLSRYFGVTAEANLQTAFSSVVFLEQTYLIGARGEYHSNRFGGRYMGYGKLLIGGANASNNTANPALINAPGGYPVFAYGGGIEARLPRHITLRAIDYEQQQWLTYHPNGLTPGIFSFGAAYRFQ